MSGIETWAPSQIRVTWSAMRRNWASVRDALTAPRQPISRSLYTAEEIHALAEAAGRERQAGLLRFAGGANATQLTADRMLHDLDTEDSVVPRESIFAGGRLKDREGPAREPRVEPR